MALLEITGLRKSFGGVLAINDVDLAVERGEIVSVIGPNGAGKTSLFNMISGMITPDGGRIILETTRHGKRAAKREPVTGPDGQAAEERWVKVDIVGMPPNRILELGIARTFQNVRLFPMMTVLENVMVARHVRTSSGVFGAIFRTRGFRREEQQTRERAEEALSFFGTRLRGYRLDQLSTSLSYANRRRLEMARAMASDPAVLLLDEPTAGMNPRETAELTELIARMRDEKGLTIVLIEHDMKVVKGVSDRVVVLDHGEKIAEGDYESVATNERVIEAYLGTKATA